MLDDNQQQLYQWTIKNMAWNAKLNCVRNVRYNFKIAKHKSSAAL